MDETRLTEVSSLKAVIYQMNYAPEGNLLEDKYFYVVRFDNCQGELLETLADGENTWMSLDE